MRKNARDQEERNDSDGQQLTGVELIQNEASRSPLLASRLINSTRGNLMTHPLGAIFHTASYALDLFSLALRKASLKLR